MEDKTIIVGATPARIDLTLPDGSQQSLDLTEETTLLGRSPECQVVLADEMASRQHALLRRQGGEHVIEDLNSTNKVLVNGKAVERQALKHGDEIRLGACLLVYSLPQPPRDGTLVAGSPTPTPRTQSSRGGGQEPSSERVLPRPQLNKIGKLAIMAGVAALVGAALVGGLAWLGKRPAAQAPAAVVAPAPAPGAAATMPRQPMATPPAPAAQAARPSQAPEPSPMITARQYGQGAGEGQSTPSQVMSYVEQGQIFYDSGRLTDAVTAWSRAVALDPNNAMVKAKLQKAKEDVMRRAEEAFEQGMRNYQYLNYEQAVQYWMQVLHLLPDPTDPLHRKAQEYMTQARLKLNR